MFSVFAAMALFGCGAAEDDGESGAPSSSEPRCAALCGVDESPVFEGAYDACSSESLEECVDLCEARVEGQSSLCAECLLEESALDTPSDELAFDVCDDDGVCYVGLDAFCEVTGLHGEMWWGPAGGYGGTEDVPCDGAQEEYDAQLAAGEACSYSAGDEDARAECHRQVHPRREVACGVEFGPVAPCADLCGT